MKCRRLSKWGDSLFLNREFDRSPELKASVTLSGFFRDACSYSVASFQSVTERGKEGNVDFSVFRVHVRLDRTYFSN